MRLKIYKNISTFRFYNSSSSFVHGGIDGGTEAEEVRGQQQIHEKIVQLNFRDCHAKIRKVDTNVYFII